MTTAALLAVLYLTSPAAYEQLSIVNYATLIAEQEGVDSFMFLQLLSCESKMNPRAKGDYRSETGEFMARGIAQFWKSTFYNYSKKYGLKGEYLDPYAQIDLAVLMIRDGGYKHWTNCMKYIGWSNEKHLILR